MKPGDLVRVRKGAWSGLPHVVVTLLRAGVREGQIGIIIDVETTPPFPDGVFRMTAYEFETITAENTDSMS